MRTEAEAEAEATTAPLIMPSAVPPHPPPPPPSAPPKTPPTTTATTWKSGSKIPWVPLAAASGACAAFNGVFAKLTTTDLTTSWAGGISTALGLSATNKIVEVLIRATFFLLNLSFNALMWALFTAALTRASSTTRVSIVNTSANFLLTAVVGWMVFGERLPGLWWVGAGGLVVGNVVIGRRERDEEGEGDVGFGNKGMVGDDEGVGYRDREGDGDGDGDVYGGGGGGGIRGAISDGVELDEAKVKR